MKETQPTTEIANQAPEGLINFRPEEWRREQVETCTKTVEAVMQGVGQEIADNFTVNVKENYDPNIEGAYFVSIGVTSSKVDDIKFSWTPLTLEFSRWVLFINEKNQGEGIGTVLEKATEDIARKLGANTLTIDHILESSMDYWKNHPEFVLDEVHHKATKQLN